MKTFLLRPGYNEISVQVRAEIFRIIEMSSCCKIAIAYFTDMDIACKIIERANYGFQTQLIINLSDILRPTTDNSSHEFHFSNAISELLKYYPRQANTEEHTLQIKTLGVQLNKTSKYTVFHHKFIVNDRICGFGSLNFTTNALTNNYENFHVSDEYETISKFRKEFDDLWSIAEPMYTQEGKIRSIACPNCGTSEGVDLESYGPFCTYCSHRIKLSSF